MTKEEGSNTPMGRAWLGRTVGLLLIVGLLASGGLVSADDLTPTPAPGDRPPDQPATLEGHPAPQRPPSTVPLAPGTGFRPPLLDLPHLTGQKLPRGAKPQLLPDEFDWRDKDGRNYVTPVKNQGNCGSCYAFAGIGAFESRLLIDGAGTFDLSENQAKECNWRALNNYGQGSCDGGSSRMMASLFSQKGTVLESCDPYQDSDVSCKSTCPYQQTLLDWRMISSNSIADAGVLKQYIYDHGPVMTSIYHDKAHGFDSLYDGSFTFDYTTPGGDTDHCVLIVGWSDNLPPVQGGAGPAEGWIVKNSWGTNWGDGGYFFTTYGAGNIGTYSSFFHDWQDYDANGDLWYYDDDLQNRYWGYSSTTGWGLARFTPPRDTHVVRVEFWTTDLTTDVDVYLYDRFDGTDLSGLLASKLNSAFDEAGYHSVALDTPLAVRSGDDVVAVVKFTNDSFQSPIPMGSNGSASRQTYVSPNGTSGTWSEPQSGGDYWDVAIRVRTSTVAKPAPTVTGITPSSGANTGTIQITNLAGSHFKAGATVKLTKTGQAAIQATNVNVVSASKITCQFNLTGAATGAWNVVVTNPDTKSATLNNGFSVTARPGGKRIFIPLGVRRWPPGITDRFVVLFDTMIRQGRPSTYYDSERYMMAGYDPDGCWGGKVSRSLLGFELGRIPQGATVQKATLYLEQEISCVYSPQTGTITAYRISDWWDTGAVTWNSQPRHAESVGQVIVSTEDSRRYSMDVTGVVQGWVDDSYNNYGIMLRGPEGSGGNLMVVGFATRQFEGGTKAAFLDVTYRATTTSSAPAGMWLTPEAAEPGIAPPAGAFPSPPFGAYTAFDAGVRRKNATLDPQ